MGSHVSGIWLGESGNHSISAFAKDIAPMISLSCSEVIRPDAEVRRSVSSVRLVIAPLLSALQNLLHHFQVNSMLTCRISSETWRKSSAKAVSSGLVLDVLLDRAFC